MKNIKISIITTCKNSYKFISYSLSSVASQTYKNLEHIIIDGGSDDETLEIIKKHKVKKKIIITKKVSIYAGINIGIKKATGDYILILNSDDILDNKNTIKKIVEVINFEKKKIILGKVAYFNNTNFNKIIRVYGAMYFKKWMFYFGLMPPHPGAIIDSRIAKKNLYNLKYKIAADFDFFLRILKIKNIEYKPIKMIITRMRTGGISGKDLNAHNLSSVEIFDSLKQRKRLNNLILINLRYIFKLHQFFFIKKKLEILEKFSLKKEYKSLLRFHFKIITKISQINLKNNFVLSALNLAFLGSYMVNQVKIYKNLIHWPDGVFIKNLNLNIKKIPGREILEKIKLPKNITKITVIGNLPTKSRDYLVKRFKRKINNKELPFGNIEKILKNFKYNISKNELILLTLPTPKQEQIAEYLSKINKNYKIICIGGSINIASGIEKKVPKYLYQYEFIWRLRYETKRRLSRLILTLLNYSRGKYFQGKLQNINIKIFS